MPAAPAPRRSGRTPRPSPALAALLAAAAGRCSSPAGARGARARARALAAACGALLATSAVANGLFAGDPWSLGISGGFASPLAAELIRDADLVVGWGCALNMWTTRHGSLLGAGATVVQVDVDADAIGAHHPVDLGVLGDAPRPPRTCSPRARRAHRLPDRRRPGGDRRSGPLARRAVRGPHRPGLASTRGR